MNTEVNDNRLKWMLGFCLLIRLIVFFIFQPWDANVIQKDILIYDAIGYDILAKCIAFDFSFCNDTFRTPVYPAFVALFYSLFGVKPWVVILFQVFLNVVSAWLLFRICLRLFSSRRIGYIAIFLFSLDPQQIVFSTYLYTDALFVFLFLWSIYLFIAALQEEQDSLLVSSGILFGLTILTRPIAIYLPASLFVFILLWTKIPHIKRLRFGVVFVVLSYVILVPWMYRNYKAYDHFALSSINGYNLLYYNAAYTEVNKSKKTYEQVCEEFVSLSKAAAPEHLKQDMPNNMEERLRGLTFEKSDVYNAVGKEYLKQNFIAAVKAHLAGSVKLHLNMGTEVIMARLHLPTRRWTDTEKYSGGIMSLAKKFFTSKTLPEIMLGVGVLVFLFFVYGTALAGWILLLTRKQWMTAMLFAMIIGYYVLISGIFYTPRYRIPFMPFYMLLSGFFLTWIISKKKA